MHTLKNIKTVLTIAGSDPTSGAGIQRDILTFKELGVRPLSAITAITVQGSNKVFKVEPVTAALLRSQVAALTGQFKVDAVKIGMLATKENVIAVKGLIKKNGFKYVVLDTIIKSSSGKYLLKRDALSALKDLTSLTTVVTPNTDEAALLTGIKITTVRHMEAAARIIYSLGTANVIITGGHLKGSSLTDVLYDGSAFTHFKGLRVRAPRSILHGTGCAFSSALAATLAKGKDIKSAVKTAKAFVVRSLQQNR
jgi:hydroxymethylpyrimidine/phosphomethylpyrimidine kinase